MPGWLEAGLRGLLAGSALLLGACAGYGLRVPDRVVAGIMAFGSGVLISALSFELMDEAFQRDGLRSTGIGFLGGAAAYTAVNVWLTRRGAAHRCGPPQHIPRTRAWRAARGATLAPCG